MDRLIVRCAWLASLLVVELLLVACAGSIANTSPTMTLDPPSGGTGTLVTASGSGFPAGIELSLRLGPPSVGAAPYSYGNTTASTNGEFTLSFAMPAQWPNSTPITETDLIVVVLSQDGCIKATAPFKYIPDSLGVATATSTHAIGDDRAILTWHREDSAAGLCDDGVLYWSGQVTINSCQGDRPESRGQLSEDLMDRLHTWVGTYQPFEFEQDGGTKDNVTVHITFAGEGARQISAMEKRTLQELLATLVPSP